MNTDELDTRLRSLELYHGLHLPPGAWAVIRVDGHGFSRFTESRFERPFDAHFHDLMLRTARSLIEALHGNYAYVESDEVSVLLRPDWERHGRVWEKVVTLAAGVASAAFTHASGAPVHFEARAWMGPSPDRVVDYFRWRQADAKRCCLNGWCYWLQRQAGASASAAQATLRRASYDAKLALLHERSVDFDALPAWQRRGTALYWERYTRQGTDPRSGAVTEAVRRRLKVDRELPEGQEYARLIRRLVDP